MDSPIKNLALLASQAAEEPAKEQLLPQPALARCEESQLRVDQLPPVVRKKDLPTPDGKHLHITAQELPPVPQEEGNVIVENIYESLENAEEEEEGRKIEKACRSAIYDVSWEMSHKYPKKIKPPRCRNRGLVVTACVGLLSFYVLLMIYMHKK